MVRLLLSSVFVFLLVEVSGGSTPMPRPSSHRHKESLFKTLERFLESEADCKAEGLTSIGSLNAQLGASCNETKWTQLVKPLYVSIHENAGAGGTCELVKGFLDGSAKEELCLSRTYVLQCGAGGKCECLDKKKVKHPHMHEHEGHRHQQEPVEGCKIEGECNGEDCGLKNGAGINTQALLYMLTFGLIGLRIL